MIGRHSERAAIKYAYRMPMHFPTDYIYRVYSITPLTIFASELALAYYIEATCSENIKQYFLPYIIIRYRFT